MTPLDIHVDLERDGLPIDRDLLVGEGLITDVGLLRNATSSGKAAVVMLLTLNDGRQVLAQTTWALFHTAAKALAASPIASEETTFDR